MIGCAVSGRRASLCWLLMVPVLAWPVVLVTRASRIALDHVHDTDGGTQSLLCEVSVARRGLQFMRVA
ncbi:hypothetical protein BST29_00435 [Mycobacterium malmoense]|uniref:Secreted protein n=1 Tax=Mycobacterium malmoense TaxID=1780 RepID=A0ABX3SXE9_MYCMA|nr:hypothetical protein BST29_00435 [Mycobacterium malmoense]